MIGKHRRRTGFRRRNGFRASLSRIEIESIGEKKPARGLDPQEGPGAGQGGRNQGAREGGRNQGAGEGGRREEAKD